MNQKDRDALEALFTRLRADDVMRVAAVYYGFFTSLEALSEAIGTDADCAVKHWILTPEGG